MATTITTTTTTTTTVRHRRITELCREPMSSGSCTLFVRRWFYRKEMERCEPFIYGGCRGNSNNHKDRAVSFIHGF